MRVNFGGRKQASMSRASLVRAGKHSIDNCMRITPADVATDWRDEQERQKAQAQNDLKLAPAWGVNDVA